MPSSSGSSIDVEEDYLRRTYAVDFARGATRLFPMSPPQPYALTLDRRMLAALLAYGLKLRAQTPAGGLYAWSTPREDGDAFAGVFFDHEVEARQRRFHTADGAAFWFANTYNGSHGATSGSAAGAEDAIRD